ncbi:hypothetical protein M422DRAFT_156047, partial [Sphaerobolus stellatus SS14]
GFVYFFTFWYKPEERSLRVAVLLASSTLGGAFGGAIAFSIDKNNGLHGPEAWRWLFILEGIPSCISSVFVLLWFPDWPEIAKWLTDSERNLAISRLKGVASQGYEAYKSEIMSLGSDKERNLGCLIGVAAVPFSSLSLFSPTIHRLSFLSRLLQHHFTFLAPYACAYVVIILTSLSADHFNARALHCTVAMSVAGITFVIQAFLPDTAFHARYALLCIASAGSFATIPPLLGWVSSNIHTTGAAGFAVGLSVSFGGPGQIIGVWIYKGE